MKQNQGSMQGLIFTSVFSGVLGAMASMALVGLICLTFFGLGYYLIVTYNKKGTKLFEDIQPMQYLGILLCFIGCLPFIQYFFFGFLSNAGGAVFEQMFGGE
jgi:hypothetical protein